MTIEARVQDIESGNIMFVRHFRDLDAAEAFAREWENEDTRVKLALARR